MKALLHFPTLTKDYTRRFLCSDIFSLKSISPNQGISKIYWTKLLIGTCLFLFPITGYTQSVDLLTGQLQFSVELGKLEANDISIPINIYNLGGALRVYDNGGDCGVGWGLDVNNYAVYRTVRGLPDEINTENKKGWLYNSNAQNVQNFIPAADDNLSTYLDEVGDFNTINNLVGTYSNDSEPDLFYVNGPGINLQFVLDGDGIPRLLTHADVSIQFYPSVYNADSIQVKLNNGLIYTFGRCEKVIRRTAAKDTANLNTEYRYYRGQREQLLTTWKSAWKLTSVESINTGTTAYFTYHPDNIGEQNIYHPVARKKYYLVDSASNIIDVNYAILLKQITLKSLRATFLWNPTSRLLENVTFEDTSTQNKKGVELHYTFYSYKSHSKIFLKTLRFVGNRCEPSAKYEFQYRNEEDLSLYQSRINWEKNHGLDFFGYFNADNSNKNTPTLYYYQNESNGRRLRVTPIPGLTATTIIPGDNRAPNSASQYGALTKVTYPTGGFAFIEWEPNLYWDGSTNEELVGPGLRVKKITMHGGEAAYGKNLTDVSNYRAITKEYEYKKMNSPYSSGLLMAPIKLGFITSTGIQAVVHNLGEEPEILYSRVKESVSGQGSTVYEFMVFGTFPDIAHGEWKATKSRIARKSNISTGNIKNGYYTFPYPPSSNYSFARGKLLRVYEYNEAGIMVREKTYTYTQRTSNPATIKGLRFEKMNDIYHYGVYEILTGRMLFVSREEVKEASHEDNTKWFQTITDYNYNSNHMLERVVTTAPDGTITTQKFKYAKDFQITSPPSTDTAAVALKALNDSFRGSAPVEQITRVTLPGMSEIVTEAQLTTYRVFENNRVLPYAVKSLPSGAPLTEASVSSNMFVSDTDYRTVKTFKEYDSEGRVLTTIDDRKNYISYHYAIDPSYLVATFYGAKAQQAVYEGFETKTSFGLTVNGSNFQNAPGWTGNKALTLTASSTTLNSSPTNQIQKNGSKYRASVWVYSAMNGSVIFRIKNGSTTVTTLALNNPVNNKWNYLEGEVNVSGAAALFTLEVATNATESAPVTVDDIVFAPALARVALQTFEPFNGTTSLTDDRGNSVKYTYDNLGRKINTLDRNRNLIQKNEYHFVNVQMPVPVQSFRNDAADTYYVGVPITFTPTAISYPNLNCDPNTTYAWEVDEVPKPSGSGNVLMHTFTTPGAHTVKLKITSSDGVVRTSIQTFCVQYKMTGEIAAQVQDGNGNPIQTIDCNYLGIYRPVLILPEDFPSDITPKIFWTTSYLPDGMGGTIITYTGTYEINFDLYYPTCTFPKPLELFGSVSCSVHQLYNPNCK